MVVASSFFFHTFTLLLAPWVDFVAAAHQCIYQYTEELMLREEEADIYFLVVVVVYGLIRRQRERGKKEI